MGADDGWNVPQATLDAIDRAKAKEREVKRITALYDGLRFYDMDTGDLYEMKQCALKELKALFVEEIAAMNADLERGGHKTHDEHGVLQLFMRPFVK